MRFSAIAMALVSVSAFVSAEDNADLNNDSNVKSVQEHEESDVQPAETAASSVVSESEVEIETQSAETAVTSAVSESEEPISAPVSAVDEEEEDDEDEVVVVVEEEDEQNEAAQEIESTLPVDEDTLDNPVFDESFLENMMMGDGQNPQMAMKQPEQRQINYTIDWRFMDVVGDGIENYFEFATSENGLMNYTFVNHEKEEAVIYAVGGQIVEPNTREVVANISVSEIGPIHVDVDESVNFLQNLEFDLPEGVFYVIPFLHIGQDEDAKKVNASPKVVRILPPTLSFFNVEFLSVFAVLAIAGYSSYKSFQGTNSGKPNKKELKAKAKTATLDASAWIPENHKK